jgi:hypothetical protein
MDGKCDWLWFLLQSCLQSSSQSHLFLRLKNGWCKNKNFLLWNQVALVIAITYYGCERKNGHAWENKVKRYILSTSYQNEQFEQTVHTFLSIISLDDIDFRWNKINLETYYVTRYLFDIKNKFISSRRWWCVSLSPIIFACVG